MRRNLEKQLGRLRRSLLASRAVAAINADELVQLPSCLKYFNDTPKTSRLSLNLQVDTQGT